MTPSLVMLTIWCSASIFVVAQHHQHQPQHKATSYQSIELEHFHAVPTYVKKEDAHLLKHPVHKGKTSADIKVHHGHKHDPGHAITSIHSSAHDTKGHEVIYEPIEYAHEHIAPESPHHYRAAGVAHGGRLAETSGEYTQAHATVALSGGGSGEEEYRSNGYRYQQSEVEGKGPPVEGNKQTVAAYDGGDEQGQRNEAGAYREYQYTVSEPQKGRKRDEGLAYY